MSIELTCPSGHKLTIADAWAGRSGRCPVCKTPVQVPTPPRPVVTESSIAVSGQASRQETPQSVVSCATAPFSDRSIAATAPVAAVSGPSVPTLSAVSEEKSSTSKAPPRPPARVRDAAPPATAVAEGATPSPIGGFTEPNAPRPLSAPAAPAAPPPLPIVVATSVIAANQPPSGHPPAFNRSSGLAPPLPPRPVNDAVFANIQADLAERPQPMRQALTDMVPLAPVTVVEAATAPQAATPLVDTLSEPAGRQTTTGYQPDADKCSTVYYLAAAMAALSLYCLAPAISHLNLGAAPNWARVVVLLSLLQLAYSVWLASIPDWSTLRSSMIIFTVVAALYGLTMTVALSTPTENPLPLDLTDVRRQAVLWCAGVVLLASLLAYGCGRAAWRWRRTVESFCAQASRRAAG
jgi:hypothetical protein